MDAFIKHFFQLIKTVTDKKNKLQQKPMYKKVVLNAQFGT